MSDRFHVLTGGPGSGKSTLIAALAAQGFAHMPEAGRAIIQDQVAIGGSALPWSDPRAFAEQMLCWDLRSHREARSRSGPVFFDRGVPDVVGYLRLSSVPVPVHLQRAAESVRYADKVFVAPFWPHIFAQDAERKQEAPEAEATCRIMTETYAQLGYTMIALPKAWSSASGSSFPILPCDDGRRDDGRHSNWQTGGRIGKPLPHDPATRNRLYRQAPRLLRWRHQHPRRRRAGASARLSGD
jgi:predicted ATPase